MKVDIVQALQRRELFAKQFPDLSSWRPWLAFMRAFYGLPMDDEDLRLFRLHTGRQDPLEGGYSEAVMITGRQSGKTYIAATVAAYEAARAVLSGQRVFIPLIAQDQRSASRALFGYVCEALEGAPAMASLITRKTATEIELDGRVIIGVYPCRPASVRGIRAAFIAIDELAFFTATDGRPTDVEMLRAARPATATTGARVLILSSPYAQAGALYDLHQRNYGREDATTLIWKASAPAMNPLLPADYLERMKADDPEAYEAEVEGNFRAGVSTFLDPAALADVVDAGIRERAPQRGVQYVAYVDAASGSGKDSFAVGIAHKDGERAVLDVVRHWTPPFNPSGVISEASDLFRRFRIRMAEGDKYAPGFVAEGFRVHGITYRPAPLNTSAVYMEFLPLVNAGACSLLDNARLLKELRGLERIRGQAGRDRVDHRRGEHDDTAVAAAGAVVTSTRRQRGITEPIHVTFAI